MDTRSIDISASGMRVQRMRMDLIANNLANVETTSDKTESRTGPDGRTHVRHVPFRRKMAVFMPGMEGARGKGFGVSMPKVVDDPADFRMEHNPTHPHAVPAGSGDKDAGYVYFPNVHPVVEMVDMIAASRAYEANLTAVETSKSMSSSALRILA